MSAADEKCEYGTEGEGGRAASARRSLNCRASVNDSIFAVLIIFKLAANDISRRDKND